MESLKTKLLLQIDVVIQFILFALSLLLIAFLNANSWAFIFFYFILGGWQVLSFLVHMDRRKSNNIFSKLYGIALLLIVLIGLISFLLSIIPGLDLYLFFLFICSMLLVGPILAICYLIISANDLYEISKNSNQ